MPLAAMSRERCLSQGTTIRNHDSLLVVTHRDPILGHGLPTYRAREPSSENRGYEPSSRFGIPHDLADHAVQRFPVVLDARGRFRLYRGGSSLKSIGETAHECFNLHSVAFIKVPGDSLVPQPRFGD
ncbi:hypothetical protein [Mycetocola saprophilus]|uniref:hypothetical protein n=1 Tax=Mycetocola saprophilus TaxID=76636 RepID=UPI0004C2211E|nr:hypothetical protein [Mycetocola saprophilus]